MWRPVADAEQSARLSFLAESFSGVSARQLVSAGWDRTRCDQTSLRHSPGGERLCAPAARRQLVSRICGSFSPPTAFSSRVEPEPNPLWEMVFGQGPGWWRAEVAGERWIAAPFCRRSGAPNSRRPWFRSAECERRPPGRPWPCAVLWGSCSPPPREFRLGIHEEPRSVVDRRRRGGAGRRGAGSPRRRRATGSRSQVTLT